ncbi:hypothetical protein HDU96_008787 [Phlyctochytrium bullatum]|nr:hypothetical protein HDU96_008787 [Phlyctochytrium bullatum]
MSLATIDVPLTNLATCPACPACTLYLRLHHLQSRSTRLAAEIKQTWCQVRNIPAVRKPMARVAMQMYRMREWRDGMVKRVEEKVEAVKGWMRGVGRRVARV